MRFGDVGAVDAALDVLNVSLDHLVKLVEDGGLEVLGDSQLVGFLQGFERLRNRLPLVDHQVLRDAQRRNLPGRLCQASLPRLLAATLRVSVPEAARRVGAAEALAGRMSMTGEPLGPVRSHLAEAQRTGEISTEQVGIAERALGRVDRPGFDPADIDAGEQLLIRFAHRFGPKELNRLALTLLCRYHHHNFTSKGWHCTINHDGLPEWSPPWWIDRNRTPLINNRIHGSLAAKAHPRR